MIDAISKSLGYALGILMTPVWMVMGILLLWLPLSFVGCVRSPMDVYRSYQQGARETAQELYPQGQQDDDVYLSKSNPARKYADATNNAGMRDCSDSDGECHLRNMEAFLDVPVPSGCPTCRAVHSRMEQTRSVFKQCVDWSYCDNLELQLERTADAMDDLLDEAGY